MRRARGWIWICAAVVLVLLATATAFAWPDVASWFDRVLPVKSADVDLADIQVVTGSFERAWVAELRWGENGLVRPGPLDDEPIIVGPGPQIAVGQGGRALLFSASGELLGTRPGNAVGYLSDGSLVTTCPVRLFEPGGALAWELDDWKEVLAREGLEAKWQRDLVRGCGSYYTSGSEVYCWSHVEVGEIIERQSPENPGQMETTWKTVDEFEVGVVLSRDGAIELYERAALPGHLTFMPWGTAFAGSVSTDKGKAFREFDVSRPAFAVKRTLYLNAVNTLAIRAGGKDGSLIAEDAPHSDGSRNWFTVYRPGASQAISAKLPDDEWLLIEYSEGCLFTDRETDEALFVSCWVWPTP